MAKKLCDADPRLLKFLHHEERPGLSASELCSWPCIIAAAATRADSQQKTLVSAENIDVAAIILVKKDNLSDNDVEAELKRCGARRPIYIVKNIWSVFVCPIHLDRLRESEIVEFIEAPRQIFHDLIDSVKQIKGDRDQLAGLDAEVSGRDVVIGIVDYGIDWTLRDFRDENGNTRIRYLWDQSLAMDDGKNEKPPAPYDYGVEYNEDVINEALVGLRNGIPLDQSRVRHRPWPKSPADKNDMDGHGTHVTGIAAGNGASFADQDPEATGAGEGNPCGVAPKAWIVFVHLDRRAIKEDVESREGTLVDSVQLLEAVHYCFRKADELADRKGKTVPCVVNLSLGFNGGSHDGASALERAIDGLLEQKGRAVTVAAGNQRGKLLDYFDTVRSDEPYSLKWRVGAGGMGRDTSANEMEIWYSSEKRLSVRLEDGRGGSIPPDGSWVAPGTGPKSYEISDSVRVLIESSLTTYYNGDAQIYLRIEPNGESESIPKSRWSVILKSDAGGEVGFHAWIEKEVIFKTTGSDRPRQSLFNFQRREANEARPFVTITTPGTCRSAISVGAFDASSGTLATFTSEGPARDPSIEKPEVVAPGVNILSNDVIFDRNDFNPTRLAPKSGTSMAAPHVAGVVALMFQLNPELSVEEIRDILVNTAAIEGQPPGAMFHPRWGYGIINARLALEEVKRRR